MSALSLKKQTPPDKKTKTSEVEDAINNLNATSSQHIVRANATLQELEAQRTSDLNNAKECVTKTSMKYNPKLAQVYFSNAKILEDRITKIKISQANSSMLVATVKADTYLSETTKFIKSVSATQGTLLKHLDVDKAESTADLVADRREQLDAASKSINGALGSVTENMFRTKLNDEQDAEFEAKAAAIDPGISGADSDFALWVQQVQANPTVSSTTVATSSVVPNHTPGERVVKDEESWQALLDNLPDRPPSRKKVPKAAGSSKETK